VAGVLRVAGNPGGLIHLRKGVVVAVDSPGAPGAEALLLRSGRISEDDWTAALRDGAGHDFRVDLVARGSVGLAELRVVATMAAWDSAFAIAAGTIEEFGLDEQTGHDVLLPVPGGAFPRELLRETARRLDALDVLPFPLSPYGDRVVPAPDAEPAVTGLTPGQRRIFTNATGRRSARDIAFAVGRGLYPVTVDISRLLARGILAIAEEDAPRPTPETRLTALRPRHEAAIPDDEGTERKHIGL
jgi:hypothetical protein